MATIGLRTRPARAALSILGVAIGIAAIVAVLGITRSSQADLLARIDRLGTNLLTVVNGRTHRRRRDAAARHRADRDRPHRRGAGARRRRPNSPACAVFRTDRIPAYGTGGLAVRASDAALLSTLDARLAHGTFLNEATARYPAIVLGYEAARGLGIADLAGEPRIWLGGRWYAVIGILHPVELAPEVDRSALIGFADRERRTSATTATPAASTCGPQTDPHRRGGRACWPAPPTRSSPGRSR